MKQNTWDYSENLNKLKPDYLIHGDDWKKSIQKKTRGKVINLLKNGTANLLKSLTQNNLRSRRVKKTCKILFSIQKTEFQD